MSRQFSNLQLRSRRHARGHRPCRRLALLVLWLWAGSFPVEAQVRRPPLRLWQSQSTLGKFYQERRERDRAKDLARQRVPAYNLHLSRALLKFHRHISDMHHRHVSCSLCRKHIKEIRTLSKKLAQAMK